jgi:NitT/TauT family transport system substrate-binding protein/putative hydroxymethylpyrimidine transport system substrate-binding protein
VTARLRAAPTPLRIATARPRRPRATGPSTAVALACALALAALPGCGGGATGSGSTRAVAASRPAPARPASALPAPLPHLRRVTLILDFTPNAIHAGIYRALAAGYYRQEHIDLRVLAPSATVEPLSLVAAGRAQFGLADGSDVMNEIARGGSDEALAAIVQQPLGGLIALASEHLTSPAQLQGRTVGITGVPSDRAVLDTEVRHAGGDPARVHVVTVGFDGAQALAAGRVAAFTGFVPADGVGLQVSGHPITPFWLSREGGPAYPGLVMFSNRALLAAEPALVRDFLAATVRGYEDTLHDPSRSLSELLHANPSLSRALTAASLNAYLPLFADGGAVPFGTLQPTHVAALSEWMVANGLVSAPVSVARYGSDAFLP